MDGRMKAVSLFSCIGVGEFFLREIGIDVVAATDIDKKRCEVHRFLHPGTAVVCGDITDRNVKESIIAAAGGEVEIVISTPPSQGMSSVGKNRTFASLASNKDARNGLILESFPLIDALSPSYIIFENVPRLLKTLILYEGESMHIEEILERKYGQEYAIKIDILNTCDFGIPQNRERVFIRLYKKGLNWLGPKPCGRQITLREAIGGLPSIEAGQDSGLKNHWARKHHLEQVEWMRHTPTGPHRFRQRSLLPEESLRREGQGLPQLLQADGMGQALPDHHDEERDNVVLTVTSLCNYLYQSSIKSEEMTYKPLFEIIQSHRGTDISRLLDEYVACNFGISRRLTTTE